MGPQPNSLEQVKLDAIKGTIRHFQRDVEDNEGGDEEVKRLDVIHKALVAEHEGKLIDGEVVEDKKTDAKADAPAKEKK